MDEKYLIAAVDYLAAVSANLRKTLSAREKIILQIGLSASHAEEAIYLGEPERAHAHMVKLSEALSKLGELP